jgi:hypothetical protein
MVAAFFHNRLDLVLLAEVLLADVIHAQASRCGQRFGIGLDRFR